MREWLALFERAEGNGRPVALFTERKVTHTQRYNAIVLILLVAMMILKRIKTRNDNNNNIVNGNGNKLY